MVFLTDQSEVDQILIDLSNEALKIKESFKFSKQVTVCVWFDSVLIKFPFNKFQILMVLSTDPESIVVSFNCSNERIALAWPVNVSWTLPVVRFQIFVVLSNEPVAICWSFNWIMQRTLLVWLESTLFMVKFVFWVVNSVLVVVNEEIRALEINEKNFWKYFSNHI